MTTQFPSDSRVIPGVRLAAGALVTGKPVAGEVEIRDIHPLDLGILKTVDSPLWRRIANPTPAATPFRVWELAEMLFQFTNPVEQSLAALNVGRNHFRELANRRVTITNAAAAAPAVDLIVKKIVAFAEANLKGAKP